MGIITSRFRAAKSTIEELETIEKDMVRLQRCRRENQQLQKKVAASILLYSIVLYVMAALLFYFLYFPEKWPDRVLYSSPLLVFPFLVWFARKMMHWYYVKRLTANDFAVNELRERKKLILEDVMEKETYKKAREILEKFDPVRFKTLEKKESPAVVNTTTNQVVRQRTVVQTMTPRMMGPRGPRPMATPFTPAAAHRGGLRQPTPAIRGPMRTPGPFMSYSPPPGPPMPRTVLPQERGTMDKLMDYLVGDGPQNRFALICRCCSSHNGMALQEEFEYLSFRCCYCYNMNPAKKMRPFAPRLEFPEVPAPGKASAQSSDADSDLASDAGDKGDATEDSADDASSRSEETKSDAKPSQSPPQADLSEKSVENQRAPPPSEQTAEQTSQQTADATETTAAQPGKQQEKPETD